MLSTPVQSHEPTGIRGGPRQPLSYGDVLPDGIHERTGTGAIATPDTAPVRAQPEWHDMLNGGDALHLGHVLDHLLGPGFPPEGPQLGRLVHVPPTSSHRDAHLVLDTYCGWYGTLARLGADLPSRPDGRSWRVHVTVKPLGFLGTYRRSRQTGRWFAGRHEHHSFGWPG